MVVVGQTLSSALGKQVMALTRFTSLGSKDFSFGTNGVQTINATLVHDQGATGVGIDSNGKIIIVGGPNDRADHSQGALILYARLSSAGAVETTKLTTFPNTTSGR